MTFFELQKNTENVGPALALDSILSYPKRKRLRNIIFYILVLFFVASIVKIIPIFKILKLENIQEIISPYGSIALGIFLLGSSLWIFLYVVEIMYNAYYFLDSEIDYEVAQLVSLSANKDMAFGFLHSEMGKIILMRCGITPSQISDFLKVRKNFINRGEFIILPQADTAKISLVDYGKTLLHFDEEFKQFLRSHDVTPDVFLGSISWIVQMKKSSINRDRWWTKDNLSRIPSLGANLSFGRTYLLEKYGHTIFYEKAYRTLGLKWRIFKNAVDSIELILVKSSGANVMLISHDVSIGMMLVSGLAKEIVLGTVLPELESKRVFVLDPAKLLDSMKEKQQFEQEFRRVLGEASSVGNAILVIDNFSSFIENAFTREINVKEILADSLQSMNLQVIALADRKGFHSNIEIDMNLMRNFDKIFVEDLNTAEIMGMLQDESAVLESKYGLFFTYQSLMSIIKGTERYFSEGSLSDKAFDLLYELAPIISRNNRSIVTDQDVDELLKEKTGIPQGDISEEEQEKFKNIEDDIHKRIIGQDLAVNAIGNALRRSRAGLTKSNRPISSFLFLGPTGVGKTEVAKALAQKFFTSEDALIRFDMSEYSSDESVMRLIGDPNGAPGILASKLREKQYGVLLLDEFEKASSKVHDLFLQIIDEGVFSDGGGNPVNARNTIIIATSNAGSSMIAQSVSNVAESVQNEKEIVSHIINSGIFKPELINRFDEVVLFHRLEKDHLRMIARLMIADLNKRMTEKSIVVQSNEQVIEFIIDKSFDANFGARNMNRFIQDTIEKSIAEAIIDKKISNGDSIYFSVKDDKLYLHKENREGVLG